MKLFNKIIELSKILTKRGFINGLIRRLKYIRFKA